ncbi:MAG: hypothetical protein AAGF12_22400 [Myxococcota bacterium]
MRTFTAPSLVLWVLWVGCPGDPSVAPDAGADVQADRSADVRAEGRPSTRCTPGCDFCEICVEGICEPRTNGMNCNGGRCYEGACCTGCWDGFQCQPGTELAACGQQGEVCEVCPCEGDVCSDGGCGGEAPAARVSSGGAHTCALTVAGDAYCWGRNISGELGTDSDAASVATPTRVPLDGVSVLAAGDGFSCAVLDDKSRWCWGDNDDGQLGLGDLGPDTDRRVPETQGPSDWATLSLGGSHGCGIGTSGSLRCWGRNVEGQLGLGSTGPTPLPATVLVGDAPFVVTDVGLGRSHSCAVRDDGTLYCWGANNRSQLGLGTGGAAAGRLLPELVSADTDWALISTGDFHTLGLRTGGFLFAFGDNGVGQLGTGDTAIRTRPWPVGVTAWALIRGGQAHSCGLLGGSLYCWGDNQYGQLGVGDGPGAREAERVGRFLDWRDLSLGANHSCAIRSGAVYCWGLGAEGRLGTGEEENVAIPRRVCLPAGVNEPG